MPQEAFSIRTAQDRFLQANLISVVIRLTESAHAACNTYQSCEKLRGNVTLAES